MRAELVGGPLDGRIVVIPYPGPPDLAFTDLYDRELNDVVGGSVPDAIPRQTVQVVYRRLVTTSRQGHQHYLFHVSYDRLREAAGRA